MSLCRSLSTNRVLSPSNKTFESDVKDRLGLSDIGPECVCSVCFYISKLERWWKLSVEGHHVETGIKEWLWVSEAYPYKYSCQSVCFFVSVYVCICVRACVFVHGFAVIFSDGWHYFGWAYWTSLQFLKCPGEVQAHTHTNTYTHTHTHIYMLWWTL